MAQGLTRYRCFLPDLTEFAVPPCTGPNYQPSTSLLIDRIAAYSLAVVTKIAVFIKSGLMAEREGFEPSVRG